jgi:hypothetical protein
VRACRRCQHRFREIGYSLLAAEEVARIAEEVNKTFRSATWELGNSSMLDAPLRGTRSVTDAEDRER